MSSPNSISPKNSQPALQSTDLTFTYEGAKTPALKDIHIEIKTGEFVIITGPSGSGKSTLARCLAGFIPHDYPGIFQGSVQVLGQDTQTQTITQLARNISLIQQDPDSQIVTLNVVNEIAFGPENFQIPPQEIRTRINWALDAVSAQSLQTRRTQTLSGGEKQKVVIASFLALQSPILLFDEPTAQLDPRTTNEVINTLKLLHNQGITILVIAHRIQPFLPYATRLILIDDGTIRVNETPTKLKESPAIITKLGVALPSSPQITRQTHTSNSILLGVQNLTFSYPRLEESLATQPALQDVTFGIQPGEMIALMGANGSGKSTLLLHLMGLLQPDTGLVHLFGENIGGYPVSKLAQNIGFIFQNPLHQLFASTVWEEILLASQHLGTPKPELVHQRAEELLKAFTLAKYRNQSPFALSVGEQRRLTIASILVHNPQLLLLDEPFIGQDFRNVHQIMAVLLKARQQNTAILLATHDSKIAETYCDRLLFLQSGRLLIDAPITLGLNYLKGLGESAFSPKPNNVEGSRKG